MAGDQTNPGTPALDDLRPADAGFPEIEFTLDTAPFGSWDWDVSTGAVRWSPSLERLHGMEPGTFGGTFEDFVASVHPDDRESLLATIEATMAEPPGATYYVVYRIVYPDGTERWLETRGQTVPGAGDRAAGMRGVCLDTTDRRQVEAELAARARQQAAVAAFGQRALGSATLDVLLDEACRTVVDTLDADFAKVLETFPGGHLRLRAGAGWPPGLVGVASIPNDEGSQGAYTLSVSEPVIVEHLPTETRFTGASLLLQHGVVSGMTTVIHGHDRPWGALGVHTKHRRVFTPDDVNFLQSMANVIAASIEQRRIEAIDRFLAGASEVLGRSLDMGQTLDDFARLVVTEMADWCAVYLQQIDGEPYEIEIAHRDPVKEAVIREARGRWPAQPDNAYGIPYVIRTGKPAIYPVITDEAIEREAQDEAHRDTVLFVGLRSALVVPLVARSETLGAIVLARADEGNPYTEGDLAVAEQLAARAAIAVDNARLYREARTALGQRDEILAREQASREILQTVNAINQIISAELDLQKLVQAVTDAGTALSGAQVGAFFYNAVDGESEGYNLYALSGVDRAQFDAFPMPRNTPLFSATFGGEGTVRLDDVLTDPRFGKNAPYFGMPAGHLPVRSYLAVSVVSRSGEVLGGLFFGHERPGVFDERAERLVRGIALQAAIALDNAALYRDAQEAVRVRDEFLSIASHELKTPLTTIKGYVQLLARQARQENLDQERLPGMVDELASQVRRMEALVADLLNVSRLQQGRLDLERQPADLSALAAEVLGRFEHSPDRTPDHRLIFDAPDPVVGMWDAGRLDEVLTNLIGNAIKYSPDGGDVQVSVSQEGESAVLTVSDQGIGIAPQDRARLFEPFARATRGRSIEGTGLGLHITAQLVERHGGSIEVESTPGRGSRFTVRLPLAAPEGAPNVPRADGGGRANLRT